MTRHVRPSDSGEPERGGVEGHAARHLLDVMLLRHWVFWPYGLFFRALAVALVPASFFIGEVNAVIGASVFVVLAFLVTEPARRAWHERKRAQQQDA